MGSLAYLAIGVLGLGLAAAVSLIAQQQTTASAGFWRWRNTGIKEL